MLLMNMLPVYWMTKEYISNWFPMVFEFSIAMFLSVSNDPGTNNMQFARKKAYCTLC